MTFLVKHFGYIMKVASLIKLRAIYNKNKRKNLYMFKNQLPESMIKGN